jgi:hypothetical protein
MSPPIAPARKLKSSANSGQGPPFVISPCVPIRRRAGCSILRFAAFLPRLVRPSWARQSRHSRRRGERPAATTARGSGTQRRLKSPDESFVRGGAKDVRSASCRQPVAFLGIDSAGEEFAGLRVGYGKLPTSPPCIVPAPVQMSPSIVSETNRVLPSHRVTFTPPG